MLSWAARAVVFDHLLAEPCMERLLLALRGGSVLRLRILLAFDLLQFVYDARVGTAPQNRPGSSSLARLKELRRRHPELRELVSMAWGPALA